MSYSSAGLPIRASRRRDRRLVGLGDGLAATGPAAPVVSVACHGPDAAVRLDLAGTTTRLVARIPGHLVPQPGDTVGLTIPRAVRAFPNHSGWSRS